MIPTQAVILVGGAGTRLRPVTSRVPKPVAPLVERPFVAYILENLARHGVERAIFSSGHLAEVVEAEIGDGAAYGLTVDYVVEEEPLGTAGAIANCAGALDDGPLFVFNGDVLSDVDLTTLGRLHVERRGMATIYLTAVEDPRRYGLVELASDGRVAQFLEKPGEHAGPALINAGVYVLEPEVFELIPPGRLFSIERGVFPRLAQAGSLYGYVGEGYWRDIGTPESYLQAHVDVLERVVHTTAGEALGETYRYVAPSAEVSPEARLVPPCYIGDGARVAAGARVGPLAVLGAGARVGAGAVVVESVVQSGVEIADHALVERSILVRDSRVGAGSQLSACALGEGCDVGAGNRLTGGICLAPGTTLPDSAVDFREQLRGREES
ncbi:MAG: NDP-sugar synthase [Thermoleophilia bacterium]|nr:NDP-sugar synthase [Thermoleophilia bacterium]